MPSPESMIIGAGALAFGSSFKESGGFPSNGYSVIAATIALVFLASFTGNGALSKPVKMLAGLLLLSSAIRYIPSFTSTSTATATDTKRKGGGGGSRTF